MRKTKIICTIGPATQDEDILKGLCKAGMNVARLNFSHNTHEDHQLRIDSIKRVREELDMPIAIMLDTKGPEYRIKTFEAGKVTLVEGQRFTFTADDVQGNEGIVSVSYAELAHELVRRGWYISFSGTLTFTNAARVREAASAVPREKLLIETDAPYLTAHPFRGKRNDSGYMRYTLEKIAEICRRVPKNPAENLKQHDISFRLTWLLPHQR